MRIRIKQKQKIVLGGLLLFLMFSSILYIPVSADGDNEEDTDEDDDGIDDEEEEINEREIQIEIDDYEAQIRSRLKTNDTKNEIEIEIETEHDEEDYEDYGLEFKFMFKQDIEKEDFELKFKIIVEDIVEFIDLDSDGIYNESADQLVQTYLLNNFKPFDYSILNDNGTNIYTLVAETTDEVFKANVYFVGEFVLINETLISPTEVKIDLEIYDFNYTEINSQLAMKIMLKDKIEDEDDEEDEEIEIEDETEDEKEERATDEKGVRFIDGDFSGFFTWVEFAYVDGVKEDVKFSPIKKDDDDKWMYLNYPRGNTIIHDPKIGVEGVLEKLGWILGSKPLFELPNLSQNELLIVSAMTFLALTGLVFIFRKKKKM